MKTKYFYFFITMILFIGCSDELDVKNLNEPTPDAVNTENGIFTAAAGIYTNMFFLDGGDADYDFLWITMANHHIMGDELFIPWGNFGWRWANQVSSITLDDGTKVTPPNEGDQAEALKKRNTRAETGNNAMAHEWISMYFVNNTCNLVLSKIEEEIDFTGDNDTDISNALKAWAYFWKGYAYSRIGSMYVAGIINSEYGKVSNNFQTRGAIITEATTNFDNAISSINAISTDAILKTTLGRLIPTHYVGNQNIPDKAMWTRIINSMKARNLLVNTKDKDKSTADWTAINNLAMNGMIAGDFKFIMNGDGNNFLNTALVPARLLLGWHFSSERLIQDFKTGDARFTRNFTLRSSPIVNRSGRGIQYGTRYNYIADQDYATKAYKNMKAVAYIGPTYEENALMRAEALINTGSIEAGLAFIDAIRTLQTSGLANVAGTGLNLTQAKEELRRERRIGLHLRGTAFYDARRWGVIDPVASGGGRTGCVVLDDEGNLNTNATFDYKYMDYFDVPQNELDFNTPEDSSIPITENPK